MKKQTKLILGSLLLTTSLFADKTTVVPYAINVNYNANSQKDSGNIAGIYLSGVNSKYAFELDVAKTDIKYKNSSTSNLKQYDYTMACTKYFPGYFVKAGLHHINTTDTDLGDGNVAIIAIGGYQWKGYDKYSYGIEGFYSIYKDGHDDNDNITKITVSQISPNFTLSKAININTRNNTTFKINYVRANNYKTKNYTSFELANTLYYKKFFTTLKGYTGKMKTGVKDGGNTVYNSKDLLKNGYSCKVGYFVKPNLTVSASYGINTFEEAGTSGNSKTNVAVASLSYTF